ncbi:MAG: putative HTH-type transcriptional regulator [Nitrosopumilus sp.]|nr:putative HTH-type transcriptional regulator [Nitrosopumilus sp.]
MTVLDEMDKDLLNEIQWRFPLVSMPFHELAKKFDTSPEKIKEKLHALKSAGVIRQLSAIFDTRKLGYKSSLVAMKVDSEKLVDVANIINTHPGVSHNYERKHDFNLWFTIATPPGTNVKTEVDKFSTLPGVQSTRMLPTIQMFKIGVKLDMNENKKQEIKPSEEKKKTVHVDFVATDEDKKYVRELQKDLNIIDRPFLKSADILGVTEDELFEKIHYYENIGVIRRFAAILRHRDVGFVANGMIVWKVPEDRIDDVGAKLGAFPQVSHCYQRPSYPDWPYNVFSMIHCKSHDEAGDVAKIIQNQIDVNDYTILFSEREFKKTRVQYFEEDEFSLKQSVLQ